MTKIDHGAAFYTSGQPDDFALFLARSPAGCRSNNTRLRTHCCLSLCHHRDLINVSTTDTLIFRISRDLLLP